MHVAYRCRKLIRHWWILSLRLRIFFGRPLSVCPVCNVGVLWSNGWMDQDQDATWHGGIGLCPGHNVLDGDPGLQKGYSPRPNFRPMSVVAKLLDGSRCHLVGR